MDRAQWMPSLFLCLAAYPILASRVSPLTEQQATAKARQILRDYQTMYVEFGGEEFTLIDTDRTSNFKSGTVIGMNGKGETINVEFKTDYNETPLQARSTIEIWREAHKRDEFYFSVGPVKVILEGDDIDFYHVTGEYRKRPDARAKSYYLDLYYGYSLGLMGSSVVQIDTSGTMAKLSGTLGARLFLELPDIKARNRYLRVVHLEDVPGSSDDRFNTLTGVRLRRLGLSTRITKDSDIASGGVDLFAAGVQRYAQRGATVGVHSWCCTANGREGWELRNRHPEHVYYLNYFEAMLGRSGRAFYFFTNNAAASDDIHRMTWKEMRKYNLITHEI